MLFVFIFVLLILGIAFVFAKNSLIGRVFIAELEATNFENLIENYKVPAGWEIKAKKGGFIFLKNEKDSRIGISMRSLSKQAGKSLEENVQGELDRFARFNFKGEVISKTSKQIFNKPAIEVKQENTNGYPAYKESVIQIFTEQLPDPLQLRLIFTLTYPADTKEQEKLYSDFYTLVEFISSEGKQGTQ